MNCFSRLPLELVGVIACYLCPEELLHFSRVDKYLHQISQDKSFWLPFTHIDTRLTSANWSLLHKYLAWASQCKLYKGMDQFIDRSVILERAMLELEWDLFRLYWDRNIAYNYKRLLEIISLDPLKYDRAWEGHTKLSSIIIAEHARIYGSNNERFTDYLQHAISTPNLLSTNYTELTKYWSNNEYDEYARLIYENDNKGLADLVDISLNWKIAKVIALAATARGRKDLLYWLFDIYKKLPTKSMLVKVATKQARWDMIDLINKLN